ncbi:hypothetical protein IGI04_008317 [Brassica rapa subsp. trilocularis]|uniref:RNase H type-1 domain-containing protein n=1 Tax=Brassica rapa subsp. trilocularis TaxID=1813537 RepID=A0ABQ7NM94_BRACM|nr:hypothetical protein IGI04_008317 [Brassica rapa subsp. trilocularis]
MISQKIVAEYSVIKGNFSSITVDLLPANFLLRCVWLSFHGEIQIRMADSLQKAIKEPEISQRKSNAEQWDTPPGFPPLFPELSAQDRRMAMMYISHSDETERLARIERVKQGIAENQAESSVRLTKITNNLDKGKGHVFYFPELTTKRLQLTPGSHVQPLATGEIATSETEAESSTAHGTALSAPATGPTGFRIGLSPEGRVTGTQSTSKSQRKRPPSWKRKTKTKSTQNLAPAEPRVSVSAPAVPLVTKRKEGFEDLVHRSWEGEGDNQGCTMDRISRCRRKIMEWRKRNDMNSKEKITCDLMTEDLSSWDIRKVREVIAEEDVRHVLSIKCQRFREDRWKWGFTRNVWLRLNSFIPNVATEIVCDETISNRWTKPDVGVVKCNVGSAWSSSNGHGGMAWIVRDSNGEALFHSRRSFVGIRSQLEADLVALVWAVEAMRDLHLNRVTLEFSSSMSSGTLSTSNLPQSLQSHWRSFNRSIGQLEVCKLVLTSPNGNLIASAIAESALHIQHHQSYMSANGPGWLESRIRSEAMAVV